MHEDCTWVDHTVSLIEQHHHHKFGCNQSRLSIHPNCHLQQVLGYCVALHTDQSSTPAGYKLAVIKDPTSDLINNYLLESTCCAICSWQPCSVTWSILVFALTPQLPAQILHYSTHLLLICLYSLNLWNDIRACMDTQGAHLQLWWHNL